MIREANKFHQHSNELLKRFLHQTPALEHLRLNFDPHHQRPEWASNLLEWLSRSPKPSPQAVNTTKDGSFPVDLPNLHTLDLGMVVVCPEHPSPHRYKPLTLETDTTSDSPQDFHSIQAHLSKPVEDHAVGGHECQCTRRPQSSRQILPQARQDLACRHEASHDRVRASHAR